MANIAILRVLFVAVLLGRFFTPSAAAKDPEQLVTRLKNQTVMITVTLRDGTVEHGAGVVLCQREGRVHVLTTYRVLAGEMPGALRSLRRPARTEIRFYGDGIPAVIDDRAAGKTPLTFRQMPDQGLVLLSFPWVREVSSTATLGRPIPREQTGEPMILTIGYTLPDMEPWTDLRGELFADDGSYLRHSAPVGDGFFGAPVFNDDGALIGIHLERIAGEADGAAAGTGQGRALSVEEVLPAIDKWVPPRCLHVSWWKETFAKMRLTTGLKARKALPQTFLAEAEKLSVKGLGSFDEKIRFGPYKVTRVERGIRTEGRQAKPWYEFTFAEPNGRTWQARCALGTSFQEEGQNPGGEVWMVLSEDTPFECSFRSQQGKLTAVALLGESVAPQDGADRRYIRLETVGSRLYGAKKSLPTIEFGHVFYDADRALAAVTPLRNGTVWIHPSVTGETRSVCLVAAAALLLSPD